MEHYIDTNDKQSEGVPRNKPFIYDYTLPQLKEWLEQHGEKGFRAAQIFDWLYVKRVSSFEEMTNLSKGLRDKMDGMFDIGPLQETTCQVSQDGTVKFLFRLRDGHSIETVVMRHNYGNSVCVTTQVGCRMGCTFCASTLGGLQRDLTAGEIVAQVLMAQRTLDDEGERVSHVVVMGIGEPFENFEALMDFIRIINDAKGLNIVQRHITVSTSGIIPKIYEFADAKTQVSLAVSLHAPNNELRTRLMPVNRAFPLKKLLEACFYYVRTTGRRITFEYGLFGGVNDQPEHAEELARIIKDLDCHVNLIPVNYVPERNYVRTPKDDIFRFHRILQEKGINATIRREQGSDIDAACGQLRAKHAKQAERLHFMETGMKSHVGVVRQINEDCGKIVRYKHEWVLALVADGMGGHQAGDVASNMAVEAIEKEMTLIDGYGEISGDQAASILQQAMEIANRQVFEYALANEECRGMGTTVAAALLAPDWAAICHIGDSRIYKWAEGRLLLLTEDHSLVNELQKSGQITEEEARTHPQRNVLVRALGTEQTVLSDMQISTWSNEEIILLCSDGLTNKVTNEEISHILDNGRSAQQQAEELVQKALDAGGDDNITVVIVRNKQEESPSGKRGESA